MELRKIALKKEYQLRFSSRQKYRYSVWKILCSDFFMKYIPKDAVLLDVGAGWGEFINNIEASKKFAMDLNPETCDYLERNITFLNQDCSKRWELNDNSLDVVFSSNFLEHLPNKESIEKIVCEAHRCLKKNGIIIILGPNIKYAYGVYWDFWDHCIPITESSCRELLIMQGFDIIQCIAYCAISPIFHVNWIYASTFHDKDVSKVSVYMAYYRETICGDWKERIDLFKLHN